MRRAYCEADCVATALFIFGKSNLGHSHYVGPIDVVATPVVEQLALECGKDEKTEKKVSQ